MSVCCRSAFSNNNNNKGAVDYDILARISRRILDIWGNFIMSIDDHQISVVWTFTNFANLWGAFLIPGTMLMFDLCVFGKLN